MFTVAENEALFQQTGGVEVEFEVPNSSPTAWESTWGHREQFPDDVHSATAGVAVFRDTLLVDRRAVSSTEQDLRVRFGGAGGEVVTIRGRETDRSDPDLVRLYLSSSEG